MTRDRPGQLGAPGLPAQVEHIALATSDADRLCGFYLLLGAVASPVATGPGTGVRSRVLDFCGVGVELFEQRAASRVWRAARWRPGLCTSVSHWVR